MARRAQTAGGGGRLARACAGAAASAAVALALAAPAEAGRAGFFNCTATGGDAFGVPIAEANPQYSPCEADLAIAPVDLTIPLAPLPVEVFAGDLYARTVLKSPDRNPKEGDHTQAYAAASITELTLGDDTLLVETVESSATATCRSSGRVHFFTNGGVQDLHLNGEQIADTINGPMTIPAGALTLHLNQVEETADSIMRTAIEVEPAEGPSLVLAQTKAGVTGNPCKTGTPPLLP